MTRAGNLDAAVVIDKEHARARAQLVSLESRSALAAKPKIPADAIRWGKHHYKKFAHEHVSFDDARKACERLGGHLAYIETAEEKEFIAKMVKHNGPHWIGGTDADQEGELRWLDGSVLPKFLKVTANSKVNDFMLVNNIGALACRTNRGYEKDFTLKWVNGYVCEWDL